MRRNEKIFLVSIIFLGFILPFIPWFVVLEMFFLPILYACFLLGTFFYLVFTLLIKRSEIILALKLFLILPVFILSQIILPLLFSQVQKQRCNYHIQHIEGIKTKTGNYPNDYNIYFGVDYVKLKGEDSYFLSYGRGFMVTEKYSSKNNRWVAYGWND